MKTMKRSPAWIVLTIVALASLPGCFPDRISWSPDGSGALVLSDHLYVTDAQGNLSQLMDQTPARISWFADSKRFAAVVQKPLKNWAEIEKTLSQKDKQEITALAEQFKGEILKSPQAKLAELPSAKGLEGFAVEMMKACLADKYAKELKPKLPQRWAEFENASVEFAVLITGQAEGGKLKDQATLAQLPGKVYHVAVAPNAGMIALTTQNYAKGGQGRLNVVQIQDGGASPCRLVSDIASWQFDWSADSTRLIYCTSLGGGHKKLDSGSLVEHRVASDNGQLLATFGEIREIAGVAFPTVTRQSYLADGRIIFSSTPVELPATAKSMPTEYFLYMVHPDTAAVISPAIPKGIYRTLPDMVYAYRVSPDGRWVSIPGQKGQVSVVELKTAAAKALVEVPWQKDKGTVIPVWRTNDELCFMVPPGSTYGSPNRPEVVLCTTDGQYRCISRNWPDAVISNLPGKP